MFQLIFLPWGEVTWGKCQGGNCPLWELPVRGSNRGGIVREGIVYGGKCTGRKAPGGAARGWSFRPPHRILLINHTFRSFWGVKEFFLTSGSQNMDFSLNLEFEPMMTVFKRVPPFFTRCTHFNLKENIIVSWNQSSNLLPQKVVTDLQKFSLTNR